MTHLIRHFPTALRGPLVVAFLALLFMLPPGCAKTERKPPPVATSKRTCIEGTVWVQHPNSTYPRRYPRAKVTAWRHGTEQMVGEAVADERGNYCLQVPLAGFGTDLRVWGPISFNGKNYTCSAEISNIALGGIPKRCGAGQECTRIDIMTTCEEFVPVRRRR